MSSRRILPGVNLDNRLTARQGALAEYRRYVLRSECPGSKDPGEGRGSSEDHRNYTDTDHSEIRLV